MQVLVLQKIVSAQSHICFAKR